MLTRIGPRWGGLASLLGGVLWAAQAMYNWQVLGRLAHTGYPAKHLADYLLFTVPLLWGIGLVAVYARYGSQVGRLGRRGLKLACAGPLFVSVSAFTEAWFYGAGVPTGMLAVPGVLCLLIGSVQFGIAARRAAAVPRLVAVSSTLIGVLLFSQFFGSTLIFNLADSREAATLYEVAVAMLFGLSWVLLGVGVWAENRLRLSV